MTDIVETLQVGDVLATARRQLERGGIHHLPVVDQDERVIGLITYHRLLEAWIEGETTTPGAGGQLTVESVMEKDVLTLDVDATAAEAARLLDNNRFGSLPVTKAEKLVGIVTAADFVRVARKLLERELHQL